jgi:hypothetical protein
MSKGATRLASKTKKSFINILSIKRKNPIDREYLTNI